MYFQLLFNTLVSGLLLALVAVGFNLIFNTTKVFHLAHGAFYVIGAYAFLQFMVLFPGAVPIAFILSMAVIAVLAYVIEKLVYLPLSKKKSGQAITLISSIGVYLFLTNLIALNYGNQAKFIDAELGSSFTVTGITIVPIQLVQLLTASSILGGVFLLSKKKWFLQVRAIISEETIASVVGVNGKKIRLWIMVLGSVLAGIGAILQMYETGIDPHRGMTVTLSASVAVIIGGHASVRGTILAALLIALLQTTTEWLISAQWKDGMTFCFLILVILWRTEGIVSFKMRVEEK